MTVVTVSPLTSAEASAAVRALPSPYRHPSADRTEAVKEHRGLVTEIEARWKAHLFSDLPEFNEAALEVIFAKAWQEGHSNGYTEVEGYFYEFVDMVQDVIQVNR